jgi:hypothetical protein
MEYLTKIYREYFFKQKFNYELLNKEVKLPKHPAKASLTVYHPKKSIFPVFNNKVNIFFGVCISNTASQLT